MAKRSKVSVRVTGAGKRGGAKVGRGRRRQESGSGGRSGETGDSGKRDEAETVERIQYSEWETQVQSIVARAKESVKEAQCPHHNIWQEPDSISYRCDVHKI